MRVRLRPPCPRAFIDGVIIEPGQVVTLPAARARGLLSILQPA